jgi:hypothetical protein
LDSDRPFGKAGFGVSVAGRRKYYSRERRIEMWKLMCASLLAVLILSSCYSKKTVPNALEELPPKVEDIIVTPLDIPVDYEIIGQVEVTKGRTTDIKGLYQELGNECSKMGGDMVINVKADQETGDTRRGYPTPALPKGYGESPFEIPMYAVPYAWGKGTIIKLKDESKRKAYWDAKKKDNLGEACSIVGLPNP